MELKLYFFENPSEMDLYIVPAENQEAAIARLRYDFDDDLPEGHEDSCFHLKDWVITEYSLEDGPIRYAMCAGD